MKLCLLLNVIDPKIGGAMIMGDRGTGKSTTVRSLVDLLPEIKVVYGDPFNSDPEDPESMGMEVRESILRGEELPVATTKITMVDLPLGATEDRVCGTIDIEKALTEGVKAFEPDSAASGWNTVEREGISISHPARFILIGSGNPEEGELRPQLLDRFGMHAQVGTVRDAELRVKIVEERARFDQNPKEFRTAYEEEQQKLQDQIDSARSALSSVQIDHELRVKISKVYAELNVDGLRGDIVTNRAAKALAALKGRDTVSAEDITTVIPNCLRYRLRKDPLESIDSGGGLRVKDFDIRREVGGFVNRAVQRLYQVRVSENFLEIHLFWAGKGTYTIPVRGYYRPSISAISVTPDAKCADVDWPAICKKASANKLMNDNVLEKWLDWVLDLECLVASLRAW
ncbi:hypothetical protein IFM89_020701 [Coptis chinensis]|uniref:magnesium chelatase n=1 Tax=Coptis chinensis TaxID=261450 RepID=A0A835H4N3_9MAGN|nr:hypothetical protein IFM89_020701 [Coptis chinensis]